MDYPMETEKFTKEELNYFERNCEYCVYYKNHCHSSFTQQRKCIDNMRKYLSQRKSLNQFEGEMQK